MQHISVELMNTAWLLSMITITDYHQIQLTCISSCKTALSCMLLLEDKAVQGTQAHKQLMLYPISPRTQTQVQAPSPQPLTFIALVPWFLYSDYITACQQHQKEGKTCNGMRKADLTTVPIAKTVGNQFKYSMESLVCTMFPIFRQSTSIWYTYQGHLI